MPNTPRPPDQVDTSKRSSAAAREPSASVDEQLAALWQRYEAKEITLDEATEEMKRLSLSEARKNLGDADYEALSEYMQTMLVE